MSESRRVLTAHWDDPSVVSLAGYEAAGGYRALRTALGMSADELIQLVKDSGLRGRGGAGFPTGMKWSFVPRDTGKPTYVTVNFDESEPGTCNNRELVEREPHALIEGAAIAARAIDCHLAFIYIRGEYLWQGQVLQRALDEAYAAGYLGRGIMGSDDDLDIVLHRGAGAYICGEETALLLEPRGLPGPASAAPAVPRGRGALRVADGDQQRRDADERAAHREQRRGLVQGGRHREGARHEDVHDQRQGGAPRQLRVADGHPDAHPARGARRRRARRQGAQGVDAGRFLDAVPHGRPPRRRPRLRVGDGGGVAARHRRDHGARRDRLHGGGRPPPGRVLRSRVLRQVHPVPRGHLVGHPRARPHRSRVRARGGPAAHGRRGREHPVPSVLRARRRRGLADPVDAHALHGRVRGAHPRRPMPGHRRGPRPRCREPEPRGRHVRARPAPSRSRERARDAGRRSRSRSTARRSPCPRARSSSARPSRWASRSRASATTRCSSPSAPAASATSRSRASASCSPRAPRPWPRAWWCGRRTRATSCTTRRSRTSSSCC